VQPLAGGAEGVLAKPIDFALLRSEIQLRVGPVPRRRAFSSSTTSRICSRSSCSSSGARSAQAPSAFCLPVTA